MGGTDFQRCGSECVREPDLGTFAADRWTHNHPNSLVFEYRRRWKSREQKGRMHRSAPGAYPMPADSRGFSVGAYIQDNDDGNQNSS